MTIDELNSLIDRAVWFSRCGEFPVDPTVAPLAAVASSSGWDWLPTSRDDVDPIHGGTLVAAAEAAGLGKARRDTELTVARHVLAAHRDIPDKLPVLVDGPHNFTPAAKGAAMFAARMAARELVMGQPDFWCRVMRLYAAGYWPCGFIRDDQRLVVF